MWHYINAGVVQKVPVISRSLRVIGIFFNISYGFRNNEILNRLKNTLMLVFITVQNDMSLDTL